MLLERRAMGSFSCGSSTSRGELQTFCNYCVWVSMLCLFFLFDLIRFSPPHLLLVDPFHLHDCPHPCYDRQGCGPAAS